MTWTSADVRYRGPRYQTRPTSRVEIEALISHYQLRRLDRRTLSIEPSRWNGHVCTELTEQQISSNLRLTINAFTKTLHIEGDNVVSCLTPHSIANVRERLLFQRITQIFKVTIYTKHQRQEKTLQLQEKN